MTRLFVFDNRDPRWSEEQVALIDRKVEEAMAILPRLEIAPDGIPLTSEERRWMLTSSFREIAKATSLDNLACAPAAMLEQFAVMALRRNHNVKGELVQLIRVFMMAYANPETSEAASQCLVAMEQLMRQGRAAEKRPHLFKWEPLPVANSRPRGDGSNGRDGDIGV
ncbi:MULTISPECIES: hypothetical protein [unclassified Burkholderia]|uniref:hypothetical protein n=1 Tax=unclassified Burkholderia TaxID=2613784 RepID=UPI002AB22E10|nr:MULTISPECIES: hypothetical protein [unclassified Burkholderia]